MAKGQQRDSRKEAVWRGVLARFARSGLSVRGFCRREKVAEPSFYAWRRIVGERDAGRRQTGPAFVPVMVRTEPVARADTGISVELRGERVLRLPVAISAERLAELIRAVESVAVEARP